MDTERYRQSPTFRNSGRTIGPHPEGTGPSDMITMTDDEFAAAWRRVGGEIHELVGTKFVARPSASRSPIGKLLDRARRRWITGDLLGAIIELERLNLLSKHLGECRDLAPETFRRLRRRMRASTLSSFHGVRQEALIAARLGAEGIPFEHEVRDQPDFVIPSAGVGVECTSVHFTNATTSDPTYKIRSAMRKKAKKAYAARDVALAIGITEVDSRGSDGDDLRQAAGEILTESGFGAVLLFSELMNLDPHPWRFESVYRRVDHWNVQPLLIAFLDSLWPRREHRIERWAIPPGPK